MKCRQEGLYYEGYLAGYRDGVRDGISGKATVNIGNDLKELPVWAMSLSARACNCLTRAGCKSVADVLSLSDHTIATMRNLGVKTAAEIADWLEAHGAGYSAWSKYL